MQISEFCLLVCLTAVMSSAQYGVRGAKLQLKSNEPIYEGDEVSLHCQLDGNPVGWTYEIYKGASTHSYYLYKVQTESTFTFSPVTHSQRGYYRCRAEKGGVYSTYSEYVWLEVSVRGAKLQLKSNKPIYEGDEVSLHCQLDGNPVGWTYEIYKGASTHSYYLYKVQTENTLTFSPVTQSQRGYYRCRAEKRGVYSTYSNDVWFEVSVLPKLPKKPILIVLPSATVWEGDTVTLRCLSKSEVTGTQLTYRFYRDETPLSQETTQNKFRVQSAQLNETGKYWCEVKEQRKETEKKQSDSKQLTVIERFSKPTLSVLPSATVWEGDTVTLRCLSKSKVTWIQLTYKFYEDEIPLSEDTQQNEFTIESAHQNQTGKYWCEVKEEGKETVKKQSDRVQLTVKERFSKPTLSVLPSATVWEGDTVTLRCLSKSEVTGIQLTYKFYEDETPLSEETQQNEFTVESAHQNQTGKYWCDVKEKWKETVKKQSDRVQLTVIAMYVTLSASPGTSVKVGDSINLTCTWEGKMSSTLIFNFLRNNETVKSSSDSAVFSINQTDKNHTGSYMCAVESSGRRQTYSNEIEIELQAFPGAGKQESTLTIVHLSVGLGLVFLILVLLLLMFAYHRTRGLPSIRSSKTGKEKGEDVITSSGGANQMDPLNKEEENPDMLYSELVDPPKGRNKGDSALEFNVDVVYSNLVKGKLMKKREKMPEESTGVLYSDIKLKNSTGASVEADPSSLYASVPSRKDKK
ncbi:Fc receptor-like protein 5 isoform X2 [Polypterus senegalus]|uniref:Fc receptor-like protein 5 isoform X2 n=1 Tax=Polypterus senegalus TaxID=55291 RepID=UPI001963BE1D|nr:Fc receptor-like protein 5 isoform X2 [Polypterus senegalus]